MTSTSAVWQRSGQTSNVANATPRQGTCEAELTVFNASRLLRACICSSLRASSLSHCCLPSLRPPRSKTRSKTRQTSHASTSRPWRLPAPASPRCPRRWRRRPRLQLPPAQLTRFRVPCRAAPDLWPRWLLQDAPFPPREDAPRAAGRPAPPRGSSRPGQS